MIEIKGVSKSFEDVKALKEVTLRINKGSVYGLIGSNGAGKTTLLKILAGVYQGDEGKGYMAGQEVFENVEIKAKVIFIPDTLYFFSTYSVRDMANFYKNIYPTWNQERFEKLKTAFDIDINKKINRLSKGMQRQVAFWLALSAMPEYLILDEPLDGLDPVMRQKVKNLIIQDVAERNMTVLISSHNLRELEDLCDTIGILHRGALILEKELDDLKSDIHKVQVAFKQEVSGPILQDIPVLYEESRGSVRLFIIRGHKEEMIRQFKKHDPVILDILPLTLEEIFIYEMGGIGYAIENVIF
ncbi:ABC transporter ATP-binding protein [Desulforamulus ruminis]|uniref:ABC transporter related protein n=1 Tax=Desulforamulus ruminis (strain ATCC 23193 / DSM 2154 / NCIMB 8452 / DL) TaxID=696281 RepID=F6DQP8_DESRL|nr:ABC transporter ATP-binding protein [Desulforamulus ruminis]AEG62045.1 ABC transporter related protein [Desulforamulus ruminis DSM 2154]